MEAAAAGKAEDRLDDPPSRRLDPLQQRLEVVTVQHHQRPAGARRAQRGAPALQPAVRELAVFRAVVGEAPAAGATVEPLRPAAVGAAEFYVADAAAPAGPHSAGPGPPPPDHGLQHLPLPPHT